MCTCAGSDADTVPMQILRAYFVLESGMPAQRIEPMAADKDYLQVRAHSQAAGQLIEKADGSFTLAAGMMLLTLTCIRMPQYMPKSPRSTLPCRADWVVALVANPFHMFCRVVFAAPAVRLLGSTHRFACSAASST